MSKEHAPLEWYIGEEPPRSSGQEPAAPPPSPGRRRLLFFLLALLLFLGGLYLIWRIRYSQALRAIRADIAQQIQRERDALRVDDTLILSSLLDPDAPEIWRAEREFEWEHLQGGNVPLALVSIRLLKRDLVAVTVQGWPRAPHTRGRVYRHVLGEWRWTAPTQALWGDPLDPASLPCGRVEAREMDAQVVREIRRHAAEVCTRIRALVGEGGTLRIAPEETWPYLDVRDKVVILPSPWILGVPENGSPVQAVLDALDRLRLARTGIEAARQREEAYLTSYLNKGYLEGMPREREMEQYAEKAVVTQLVRFIPLFVPPGTNAPTRLDAPLRVERMRLMGDWAWVVLSGEQEGSSWYVVRFYHHTSETRWLWSWGDFLAWGPRLRLESECITVTYRTISGPMVRDVWADWRDMCRRSRDDFGFPEKVPMRVLLSLATPSGDHQSSAVDMVVIDPARWIVPVSQTPENKLRLVLAANIASKIMKPIPSEENQTAIYPFKTGMTVAYLLPSASHIVPWARPPSTWPHSYEELAAQAYDVQANVGYVVGRYIRQRWGDTALLSWLRMVRYSYLSPDIADESTKLTVGLSFAELLQQAEAP